MTCEEVRLSLGAHALGALEPDEAVEIDNHLAGCDACLEEFTGLATMPPMLAKVSERDIALVAEPPRQVLDRLLATTARKKRRGRWLLSLAASVAILAVGGTVWSTVRTDGGSGSDALTSAAGAPAAPSSSQSEPYALAERAQEDSSAMASTQAKSPEARVMAGPAEFSDESGRVRARATVTEEDGGTKVTVTVRGLQRDDSCQLVVVGFDGNEDYTAVWTWDREYSGKTATFERVSSTPVGQVARLKLVDVDRKVLAELDPVTG